MSFRIRHNRKEIEIQEAELEQLMGGWIPNFSSLTESIKSKILAYILEEAKKAIADPENRKKVKLLIMTWVSTKEFGPKLDLIKPFLLEYLDDILDILLELEIDPQPEPIKE